MTNHTDTEAIRREWKNSFEGWWMLLSKVPYMNKREIAECAWNAATPPPTSKPKR